MNYDKGTLSFSAQIRLLQSRGLTIKNEEKAEQFLAEVSYYRLSPYYEPFESSPDEFKPDATFDDIMGLYKYDRQLRQLLDKALEIVEIYLRAKVIYVLAAYGPFMHEDEVNFEDPTKYSDWIKRVRSEATRSREDFIYHYKEKYFDDFPKLPMWMVTEVISFGTLAKLLYALKSHIQIEICREMGFHRDSQRHLNSWINSLSFVRNLCAHRARLWNREIAFRPWLPRTDAWYGVDDKSVGAILYILNEMLSGIPSAVNFRAEWQKDIELILNETTHTNLILRGMGFDLQHPLWRER